MRTILIGADFMYNSNGDLVPIEINTNASMDKGCIEPLEDIFDISELVEFIISNNFTKVIYLGSIFLFNDMLETQCTKIGVEFEHYKVFGGKTIPYLEDDDQTLIIRSAYDASAIIDEEYCANKINFMDLIKLSPFSSQFAYVGDDGSVVSNITNIPDNGDVPNFILKPIYPHYNMHDYPKFFKVNNQDELDVILKEVDPELFLMEYYYNPDKLYNDQVKLIRSYNILYPPDLKNISVGQYTKLTSKKLDGKTEYDPNTFELIKTHRRKYLSSMSVSGPKLLDTDLVEMADDTFKSGDDLQIGDFVKTIDIYNPHDTNVGDPCNDFKITYDEFISGTTYTTNKVTMKERVSSMVNYVTMVFTDGTTWGDTESSSYLLLRNDNVQYGELVLSGKRVKRCGLEIGDQIILVKSDDDELTTVLKEVASVETIKKIFEGWEITVEEEHLFLTKAEDSDSSYVAIEHNITCANKLCCSAGCGGCFKTFVCCWGTCINIWDCPSCP